MNFFAWFKKKEKKDPVEDAKELNDLLDEIGSLNRKIADNKAEQAKLNKILNE